MAEDQSMLLGMKPSCWSVLGIAPGSDEATIKRAYAALVRLHPPEGDAAEFQRVREAYEQALAETAGDSLEDLEALGKNIDWQSAFDPFGFGGSFGSSFFDMGAAYGKKYAEARDARPCPKCGAAVGVWCTATKNGKATLCRERLK